MSDVDDLLREMDRDGDGWYGRASHALQSQRQLITQQAQEMERVKEDLDSSRTQVSTLQASDRAYAAASADNVQQRLLLADQLAAMTTERDELNVAVTSGIRHRQEYVERIDSLVIELAASQARCRELEARRFPIMRGPSVPWEVMSPHESMAQKNHSQTLQRLAERGGLAPGEAWCVVSGIQYGIASTEQWQLWDAEWFKYAEQVNLHYSKLAQLQATLAAREAELQAMTENVEFLGATKEPDGSLRVNMKKYHAVYRCEDHRGDPWRGIDTEQSCFVCLKQERDAAVQDVKRAQLTWTTARPTVAGNYWVRALMMHAGGFERGSFIVLFDGKVAFIATRNEVIPIEVSSMKDSEWAGPIPMPTEPQQARGSSGGDTNHDGVGA